MISAAEHGARDCDPGYRHVDEQGSDPVAGGPLESLRVGQQRPSQAGSTPSIWSCR